MWGGVNPRTFRGMADNCLVRNGLRNRAGLREVSCGQDAAESGTASGAGARWYALRDLKRPNALHRAWETLEDRGMEVFTPKRWKMATSGGRRRPKEVAVIPDLLFVHDTRENLDPVIGSTATLQYRFRKYGVQNEPIVVPDADMERFVHAVGSSRDTRYYLPEEITPEMLGRRIRIIGGPLDGYEGSLLTTRGSRVRRLMVWLPNFLAAGVEVNPEFIQLVQ